MSWIERVEAIVDILKGSSIEEIELAEEGLEIIIRRSPGNVVAVRVPQQRSISLVPPAASPSSSHTLDMKAPLTGVYYSAPAPTAAPFLAVGDIVTIGQTIALIEAMKVFSEIPSEVAGRVVAIKARNADVVKKGDVLFQVEPL